MTTRQYLLYLKSITAIKLSRKEQNFINRQQELVEIALAIIETDGISGLSMDKLTADSDYSKGTIYNHFKSKDDVLSAIAIYALDELNDLFSLALSFNGNKREKILAMHYAYYLYAQLKTSQFLCVLSCKTSAVAENTSDSFQLISVEKEEQLLLLLNNIVEQAIANNELSLSKHSSVEAITFSHWAMSFGTLALMTRADNCQLVKQLQIEQTLIHNLCVTLDGLDWQPLSKNWDYLNTIERIKTEIFSREVKQLKQLLEQSPNK